MADNISRPGFSVYQGMGAPYPKPIRCTVATAASFDVNGGASNCALRKGDPVTMLATGTVTLAQGYEASGNNGDAVFGIVDSVGPYWDATNGVMVPSDSLPSDIAWGTIMERQSVVYVIPVEACLWEIECDDAVTATTEAAYRLLVGLNCDHTLAGASAPRLNPRLDISQAITATAQWRIIDISQTANNRDYSGNYVKLVVRANEAQSPFISTTGI